MRHPRKRFHQCGQSIIEVLIATAIVGTVLTTIAYGMSLSLKNTSISKAKVDATKLSQAGLEVFRRERDQLGWVQFQAAMARHANNSKFCFNTLPTSATFKTMNPSSSGCGTATIPNTIYTREAQIFYNATQVEVILTVTWKDGLDTREVVQTQEFQAY